MLQGSDFRAVVSGRRRGLGAGLLRGALRLAEGPYSLAVRWRNHRYDARRAEIHRAGVPVVSVGNLTLGGTGKTPLVEWLARWFRAHGVRVALISRGYRAQAGAFNDEALELGQKLPEVPHVQNRDRVAAARLAIEQFDCQLILLDDAFQHRRIARDLDIVVLDALEPFGFEHVFPRGTLREPLAGLARANVIVLSRADLVSDEERGLIRRRVARLAPEAAWIEARHAPRVLRSAQGGEAPLATFAGRRVAAFCGIGNPAGFRASLAACGYEVVALREYADHFRYERADVEALLEWAQGLDVAGAVTTHKDLVKLGVERLGRHPLWALVVGFEILAGQREFEARLAPLVPRPAPGA